MTSQTFIRLLLLYLFSLPLQAAEPAQTTVWGTGATENDFSWSIMPAFDSRRPESGIDLFAMEQRKARFAAGLERKFNEKLSLDLGFNLSQNLQPVTPINYQDFYLGMSYGSIGGRVWLRDRGDQGGEPGWYYEAGWQGALSRDTSVSLQLGQGYRNGGFERTIPDLSISAHTRFRDYRFGVRLIDHSGFGLNNNQDFSLIGSIQKRFP